MKRRPWREISRRVGLRYSRDLMSHSGRVSEVFQDMSFMMTGARRVTVIGRRSAGTNGNVTRLLLPGQMAVSFTGMGILFPDQSRFHGVGIVPHIEVAPTLQDIAHGTDPELLRAIQFLHTGQ